jgi:hypothetical protein
VWKSRF